MLTRIPPGLAVLIALLGITAPTSVRAFFTKEQATTKTLCLLDDGAGGCLEELDYIEVDLTVYVAFLPTSEDLAYLQEQMQIAKDLLCDTTDARVWLNNVNVTVGEGSGRSADIYWYPDNARSNALAHVYLYGRGDNLQGVTTSNGTVIAHELGHYILGALDEYSDARANRDWCGWGPSFDEDLHDEVNTSLMQTQSQRCVNQDGLTIGQLDPVHYNFSWPCGNDLDCGDFTTDVDGDGTLDRVINGFNWNGMELDVASGATGPCNDDMDSDGDGLVDANDPDCQGAVDIDGDGAPERFTCEVHPLATELSVALNADLRMGDWAEGGTAQQCPAVRPSAVLMMDGDLTDVVGFATTCGNGTMDPGEQCGDDGTTTIACDALGRGLAPSTINANCVDCRWDVSSCGLASLCGNGALDPGEECDASLPGPPTDTCDSLANNSTNGDGSIVVPCNANCTLDVSVCPARIDPGGFGSSCGGFGIRDTNEECDVPLFGGGPDFGGRDCASYGFSGGSLSCDDCWIDRSGCFEGPRCQHNGVVDGTEECDPTVALAETCADRGFAGGTLACSSSCVIDESQCELPPSADGFDPTSFETLNDGNQLWPGPGSVNIVDSIGAPSPSRSFPALRYYVRRFNENHWTLLFAMDEGDFTGGTADEVLELASFDLEFDPTTQQLVAINGTDVDAEGAAVATGEFPTLSIGGSPPAPFGVLTNGAEGQTDPTPAWAADPMDISLRLSNFTTDRWYLWTGAAGPPQIRARMRALVGSELVPHQGVCQNQRHCEIGWNSTTGRFESTAATLTALRSGSLDNTAATNPNRSAWGQFTNKFPQEVTLMALDELPDTGVPNGLTCGGAVAFNAPPLEPFDQLMLVLDRSGSMSELNGTTGLTRLQHVQAAAKEHTELVARATPIYDPTRAEGSGDCDDGVDNDMDGFTDDLDENCIVGVRAGLAAFNSSTCDDDPCFFPVGIGEQLEATAGDCSDGADNDGDDLEDGDDPDCRRRTLENFNDTIDSLTASGNTGIGVAMNTAAELFDPSAYTRAMVVLTDDENNRPEGWEGTEDDPAIVAARLRDEGFLLIFVLVGKVADRAVGEELAAISGGEMYDATEEDELPPVFLQAFARERGQDLAIARTDVAQAGDAGGTNRIIDVPVEPGVPRINLLFSSRDMAVDAWTPDFSVRDPGGNVVVQVASDGTEQVANGARILRGDGWKILQVDNPTAGTWKFHTETFVTGSYTSHFAAHVENPLAGCDVRVEQRMLRGRQDVRIHADARYGLPLHEGVTYTARVRRPDGSYVSVDLTDEILTDEGIATLDKSIFDYRGSYEIVVACDVSAGATYRNGENNQDAPDLPTGNVPAFHREDRTSVYVNDMPWRPDIGGPDGDNDGDGIPNRLEPPITVDTDGDGLPDRWDSNADGALGESAGEVPDALDPDPQDPNVPAIPLACSEDSDPPVFAASTNVNTTSCYGPTTVQVSATATDGSCPDNGFIELSGQLVSKNGNALAMSFPVENGGELELPQGQWVVRWTAEDVNGNTAEQDQTITVTYAPDSPAACCNPGQSLVEGNNWPNFLARLWGGNYCMFGYGSWDDLKSLDGTDYLSGGDGHDVMTSTGDNNVMVGGDGNDTMGLVGEGHKMYGGPGHDAMDLIGSGEVHGGTGNDFLIGHAGDQVFVPGPGLDLVEAGKGDDHVHIYDVCELEALEVLDGGFGTDTLYTPVSVVELNTRGVVVLGFENIVVTSNQQHLSECF